MNRTTTLGNVTRAGDHRVAAIMQKDFVHHRGNGGEGFWVELAPVAILTARAGDVKAFAPDGTPLSRDELEALCPGATDEFAAAISE